MRIAIGFLAAVVAWAQGTTPKTKASDYPVHDAIGSTEIGADYMVHSFGRGEQLFIVERYLVVEVALFPPKDGTVTVDPLHFGLRVNGKKIPITPQPPSMVAAHLKHREWGTPKTTDIA